MFNIFQTDPLDIQQSDSVEFSIGRSYNLNIMLNCVVIFLLMSSISVNLNF